MSRTGETRHIKKHETCNCKCRLGASACNNKQRWNNDKCQYECKELIDKGVCDKGYAWNPSNCKCEFGKSLEEYNENSDEEKLTEIDVLEHINDCSCCYTVFIVLGAIALAFSIGISTYFN